ncbi:MAG TPA: hypothetical protein VMG82_32155 [Candidatus Sulfotelmatobacter sp.]|nr:hypothetical protein [Candidatus Sulfotelmatobacter sp.]
MTVVERVKKELGSLESKKHELETRRSLNRQRKVELDRARADLVVNMRDDDDGAERQLRSLDQERHAAADNEEAYAAGLATLTASIQTKEAELRRAERAAVIEMLETEIKGLDGLNTKVVAAMRGLHSHIAGLVSVSDRVAGELTRMDPAQFDGTFAHKLRSGITDGVLRALVDITKAPTSESLSFVEFTKTRLRGACAQLRYLSLEGVVVPEKDEKVYVAHGHLGIRDVQLHPGERIALRDDEFAEFVRRTGPGWLIPETPAA